VSAPEQVTPAEIWEGLGRRIEGCYREASQVSQRGLALPPNERQKAAEVIRLLISARSRARDLERMLAGTEEERRALEDGDPADWCPDCGQETEFFDDRWRHKDPNARACFLYPMRGDGTADGPLRRPDLRLNEATNALDAAGADPDSQETQRALIEAHLDDLAEGGGR